MRFIQIMGLWTVVLLLLVTKQVVQANIIAPVQEQLTLSEIPEQLLEPYPEPEDSVESLNLTSIDYPPENETELTGENKIAEGSQIPLGISLDIEDDIKTFSPLPDISISTEELDKHFPQHASANENSGGYYSLFAQPPDFEPNYKTHVAIQNSNISGDEDFEYETFEESLKLDQLQPREETQDYDPTVELEAIFDHKNSSVVNQTSDLASENEDFEYAESFPDHFIPHQGKQNPPQILQDEFTVPEDELPNNQSEDPVTELTTLSNLGIPTSTEHFLKKDLLHPDDMLNGPKELDNVTEIVIEIQNTTIPSQDLKVMETVDGFSHDPQIKENPRIAKHLILQENETSPKLDFSNASPEVNNSSAIHLLSFTPFNGEGEFLDPVENNVTMDLTTESEIINDKIDAENSDQSQNQVSGLEFGESLQYTVASQLNFQNPTPKTELFDNSQTIVSSTQEPDKYSDHEDSLNIAIQNPLSLQDRPLESQESLFSQGTASEQDQFRELSQNSYSKTEIVQDHTDERESQIESLESEQNIQDSDQQSYLHNLQQNSTIGPLISQGRSLETETIEESLESHSPRTNPHLIEYSDPATTFQNQTPDPVIEHDSFEGTDRSRELNTFSGDIRDFNEFSIQPDLPQNPTISSVVSQGRSLETQNTRESLESRAFHRPVQEHSRLTEQQDSSRKIFPVPVALRNPSEETPVLKESQGILRLTREPSQFDNFGDASRRFQQSGRIRFPEDIKNNRDLGKGTVPLFNPPTKREGGIALQPTPVEPGMPYQFSYAVKDPLYGTDFGHQEDSDGVVVTGQYYVVLPDGRKQTVQYKADGINGYQSAVEYKVNTPDEQNTVSAGNFNDFSTNSDNLATSGQNQQGITGDFNGNQQQILSSGFDGGNDYQLIDENGNNNLHQGSGGDISFVDSSISSLPESSHNFQTLDNGNQFHSGLADNIQYQNGDSGNQNIFDVQGGNLHSDFGNNEHQTIGNSQLSFINEGDPFLHLDNGDQSQGFHDGNPYQSALSSSSGDLFQPSNHEQYQLSDTESHIQVSNAGDQYQPYTSGQYQPLADDGQSLPLYPPHTDNGQYQPLDNENQYQPIVGSDQFLPHGANQYLESSGNNQHLPSTGSDNFGPSTGDPFALPQDGDQYDQYQALDSRNKFHSFRGDGQFQETNGDIGNDQYQPPSGGNQNNFFDDEFNGVKSTDDTSSNDGRFSPSSGVNHYSSSDAYTHDQNIEQNYQLFTSDDQFQPLAAPPNDFEHHQPFTSSEKNAAFSTESHFQAFHNDQNEHVTEGHIQSFDGGQDERVTDSNVQAYVGRNLYKPAKRDSSSQTCNCAG